jgi:hypothetical protein
MEELNPVPFSKLGVSSGLTRTHFLHLFDQLNGDVCCYERGKSTSHELEAPVYTRKKHILLVYTIVAPHFLFMIVAPRQMICFFLV